MLFVRPEATRDADRLHAELKSELLQPLLRKYAIAAPLITHYTSVAAMRSILTSGKLRMSHFRYLNDSTEMLLGRTAVNDLLGRQVSGRDFASQFFDYCRFAFNEQDDRAIQYFVSSFSTLGDSPELWRRYGDDGAGVALQFETRRLAAHPDEPYTYYVAKVTYSSGEQVALLAPAIDATRRILGDYVRRYGYDLRDAALQRFSASLCSMLNHHSISMKSAEWSIEHEWRTVFSVLSNDSDDRKARVESRPDGRPYVDVEIRSAEPQSLRMPIRRVLSGPKAEVSAIHALLEDVGYGDVEVLSSGGRESERN